MKVETRSVDTYIHCEKKPSKQPYCKLFHGIQRIDKARAHQAFRKKVVRPFDKDVVAVSSTNKRRTRTE